MANAGLPVPPGFTITTTACMLWYENGRKLTPAIESEMESHVRKLEKTAGLKFGSTSNPLLVSVRSGAKFSMPGMMDTILNLGLNDQAVEGLKKKTGNGRFAYDSYRRFIQMFGSVVLEIGKDQFEHAFEAVKHAHGAATDTDLGEDGLKETVDRYKALIKSKTGKPFPQDPFIQLRGARDAVFRSWNNDRAKTYRRLYEIPDHIGTAVNVQQMVFGNTGDRSATGVGFTRNPATGANEFFGEFLVNAQGEDVVAGVRTPLPIAELAKVMPKAYKQLHKITTRLEKTYRDIQDFEFTIEEDKLYMLQTRNGKRTGYASVVIATDFVKEKLVSPKRRAVAGGAGGAVAAALAGVRPGRVEEAAGADQGPARLARRRVGSGGVHRRSRRRVGAAGQEGAAGPQGNGARRHPRHGSGRGRADGDRRHDLARGGGRPPDGQAVGGRRRRAGRQREGQAVLGGRHDVKEGDWVSFDGLSGEVKVGQVATKPSEILQVLAGQMKPKDSDIYQRFDQLLAWADKVRTLGIRANADLPDQAELAYAFGARGIGLCRTEHMFFGEGRIEKVQQMILADNEADRRTALDELLPLQRADFYGVFKAMHGKPVTIRTIDPPLHEFLPKREDLMVEVAKLEASGKGGAQAQGEEEAAGARRAAPRVQPDARPPRLRLGIAYPEITEMQARAIFEAAAQLQQGRPEGRPRGHDPAGRPGQGAQGPEDHRGPRRQGRHQGAGRQVRVPRRAR